MSRLGYDVSLDTQMGIQPARVDGKYVFDDRGILAEMEKHHIGEKKSGDQILDGTTDEITRELNEYLKEARQQTPDDSVLDYKITDDEIKKTYGLCSKTPGPDEVTTLMIDHAVTDSDLMNVCLRLWNTIWSSGRVPDMWKLEHRLLLQKPGKDTCNECSSYRTVSVTAVLGKRFETYLHAASDGI